MSDTSQGPGWWLASDGKWYPPEMHPDPAGRTVHPHGSDRPQGRGWWVAADGKWYPPELHPGSAALVHPHGADRPQGPRWWLASDGRWYPPELHPDVLAAATATLDEPSAAAPLFEPAPEPEPAPDPAPEPEPEPVRAEAGAYVPPTVTVSTGRDRSLFAEDADTLTLLLEEEAALAELAGTVGRAEEGDASHRSGLRSRRRTRVLELLAVLVLVAGVVAAVLTLTHGSSSSPKGGGAAGTARGWTVPGMKVTGGPVSASGSILVVALGADGAPSLVAVDPASGTVRWRLPFSPSDVSPTVPIAPLVSGTVVLDMAPQADPTADGVIVKGVDVHSGRTLWSAPGPATVVDAPQLCTHALVFCLTVTGANATTALVALAPTTGAVLGSLPGPAQQLTTDLYRTSGTPAALEQIAPAGTPAWTTPVATVFGGPQFGTQYGWNFATAGAFDVGSVGVAPTGNTLPLDQVQTVGLRTTDGGVAWHVPGAYQCFGVLPVSAPFLCHYSGPGVYVGGTLSTAGTSLDVQGIDPTTGAVTWSQPLPDAQAFTTGDGVPVADATHVVVTLPTGRTVLDLVTGRTAPVVAGGAYWCGHGQQVTVQGPAAALVGGRRIGTTLFSPCTADGRTTTAVPPHRVPGIGVSADGLFVWASPNGLVARAVG